jgi:hypothetical protein
MHRTIVNPPSRRAHCSLCKLFYGYINKEHGEISEIRIILSFYRTIYFTVQQYTGCLVSMPTKKILFTELEP